MYEFDGGRLRFRTLEVQDWRVLQEASREAALGKLGKEEQTSQQQLYFSTDPDRRQRANLSAVQRDRQEHSLSERERRRGEAS